MLQSLYLDTPLSGLTIQRNYMQQKITVCRCNWGKFWIKNIQKDKKQTRTTRLPFPRSWEQACKRVLRLLPALSTTKGWASYASHPSGPTPGYAATLCPHKEPTHSSSGSKEENLLLVFALPCCSRGHNKALPGFFVWLLINFY